jgi:hypothetical protein
MPDSLLNPIELAAGLAFVLLIGLVLFEGVETRMPDVDPSVETAPRKPWPRRGLVAAAGCVLLLALAVGGCVYVNAYEPLRAEGPAVGSGPLYLGTVPATFGGVDSVEFAAVSGGEMRMEFGLANTGDWPVTVVGMDNPISTSSWVGPQGEGTIFHSGSLVPIGESQDASGRFDIPSHASARVVASIVFGCIGRTPTPTLGPGKSPSAQTAMAARGFMTQSIDRLPIEFQFLGGQHQSIITLPANVAWVAVDMSGCGGSQDPYALPSGLYVTPVPSIVYP